MGELRITIHAGDPTAEEVAALSAVIAGLAAQPGPSGTTTPPAWSRAARLESTGQAPLSSSADPRLHGGRPGATRR